jgi:nitrate/nitrite transport system permease protein
VTQLRIRSLIVSVALLAFALLAWEVATTSYGSGGAQASAQSGYQALLAGSEQTARIPPPSKVFALAIEQLADPFYDRGPNDKGIGIQLMFSLGRVAVGYAAALLVAIPLGFLIGMSPLMLAALNPYIQLLKPVSPLAWMPLALFIIKDSVLSSIFVIFICSLWPILINTAFGVASVRPDFINVARTLELSALRTAFTVILPAAAPTILTGMRISIGISWLVIVAAEMLVGGTGIGYYVWNEWNNLDLAAVIFSILMIGLVGMALDFGLSKAAERVSYRD